MTDGEAYRVLLCEDEPLLLGALARKVEKAGQPFRVVGMAQNGREALGLLKDQPVDLLITDIRMPVMDGMELLRAVMDQNLCQAAMLLSGYNEFEYARAALRLGAFDYLLKPVSQDELTAALVQVRMHLGAASAALPQPTGAEIAEALEAICLYIKRHAFEEISLSALLLSMNYSAAHLSRLFAKKYGDPPQRYQTALRINEAKRLLLGHSELSIRQIAERVGYQDQGYFSRIFRQMAGVSPQQYREQASV